MLAIQQEIAKYSHTFDSGDADGWAKLFIEDGVWESFQVGATESATKLDGHDALRAFCEQRHSERRDGVTFYHHQSGTVFDELSTDAAETRTMVSITVQKSGEPASVFFTGVYRDEWVKMPEGWRIKHRVLRP